MNGSVMFATRTPRPDRDRGRGELAQQLDERMQPARARSRPSRRRARSPPRRRRSRASAGRRQEDQRRDDRGDQDRQPAQPGDGAVVQVALARVVHHAEAAGEAGGGWRDHEGNRQPRRETPRGHRARPSGAGYPPPPVNPVGREPAGRARAGCAPSLPPKRLRRQLGIQRIALRERARALRELRALIVREVAGQRLADHLADLAEVVRLEAAGGERRGADAQARRHRGRARVERNGVAVDGDAHVVQAILGLLAVELGLAQVGEHEVDVGPAGEHVHAGGRASPRPRSPRPRACASGARGTGRTGRSSSPPPCPRSRASAARPADPGTRRELIFLANSSRHRIIPPRGPPSVLCVVVVTTSQ